MSLNIQMKKLINQLREDTVVSVILSKATDVAKFKRRLSVHKTRASLEGKLDFTIETLDKEFMKKNYNKDEEGVNLTIVLIPYPDGTEILAIKAGEL